MCPCLYQRVILAGCAIVFSLVDAVNQTPIDILEVLPGFRVLGQRPEVRVILKTDLKPISSEIELDQSVVVTLLSTHRANDLEPSTHLGGNDRQPIGVTPAGLILTLGHKEPSFRYTLNIKEIKSNKSVRPIIQDWN